MMCGECNEKRAIIRYAETTDGRLSTWNLCEECARRRGVAPLLSTFAGPLVNILMGLLEESRESEEESSGAVCPQCGLSYGDFRRSGKLGCGVCYETFREELRPLIRRVHGSTSHAGRAPLELERDFDSRTELKRLKNELRDAVRREEYERAAELRDLIRGTGRELPTVGGKNVDVRDDAQ
jgi:protein arginine kinase activator